MEVCSNLILLRGQDIDRFYKQFLNGFLVQMGRCAFLTAVKFMIALPYVFPILARGMPYFGTVPTCAVSAFYFTRKDAHAALTVLSRSPERHLFLHRLKHGRFYYSSVTSTATACPL